MKVNDIIGTIGLVISGLSVLVALIIYLLNMRNNKLAKMEYGFQKINNNIHFLNSSINEELFYSIVYSFFYDEHIQTYLQDIFDNLPDSVEEDDIEDVMKQIISNRLKIIPYACEFDIIKEIETVFSDNDLIKYFELSNFKYFCNLLSMLKNDYVKVKQNIITSMKKEDELKYVIATIIKNDRKTIFTINQFTNMVIDQYINATEDDFRNYIRLKCGVIDAIELLIAKMQEISHYELLKIEKKEKTACVSENLSNLSKYEAIQMFYQKAFPDTELAGKLGAIKTTIE